MPYVQKTLEEATFEHNKNHTWNFKDLFKRKDYMYLQRDKTVKSCFVCGKYNHTASTCFYYLQQQRNLKQQLFEKTTKNKKVRSYEARSTQFRKFISPPRQIANVKPPKAKQSCIIRGESGHFAANFKFNPFNQFSQSSSSASTKQPSNKDNTWVVDSGCSRHMTGNRSILLDFRKLYGGYVAFGSNSKGGSIIGQGTVSNERMSIERVNYVKELKFNLMSVSQICDQKHWMLFINEECFVLSSGLSKTPPEKILLTAQRKENLYVLDMNKVTPSGSVSCFLSKESVNEAALWHRRLSHVNVKTINKLVKENLVRGLPDKEFQLEDHCIACLKGKQHKSSHKTKKIN
ncbi:hypothetical protein L1987_57849 [Smallanthus sonchifolius]|uniref:Uncharacterized protein n=1 Tax=Smallanthus sonchifolius TaxID=185202 RepID=A0ACB9DDN0_9ASTR|nr:hypothetical protein L1987_57849 [Smallanthus sonchifolius]